MSDEQKPDGWVAWHPDSGIEIALFAETGEYVESMMGDALEDEKWRIRPVKLVFLDEVKDGE